MKIKDYFYVEKYDPTKEEIPSEWWLERYRNWRIEELKATDWTQLPDAPVNTNDWSLYRQKLRDLPATPDFAEAEIPARPE
jgi:hypothetical protein